MGFLDTDFGKMILFMVLGGIFLVLIFHFSKPSTSGEKAAAHTTTTPKTSLSGAAGDNPYEAANLIG